MHVKNDWQKPLFLISLFNLPHGGFFFWWSHCIVLSCYKKRILILKSLFVLDLTAACWLFQCLFAGMFPLPWSEDNFCLTPLHLSTICQHVSVNSHPPPPFTFSPLSKQATMFAQQPFNMTVGLVGTAGLGRISLSLSYLLNSCMSRCMFWTCFERFIKH